MKKQNRKGIEKTKDLFQRHGGILRTSQIIKAGIHSRILYAMLEKGVLERIDRGLYRLKSLPPLGNPDLAIVAMNAPDAIVCLISSLSFHGITTQVPHEVYLAIARNARPPKLGYPPVKVFWFTGKAFTEGIETHSIDGVSARIYSPEKTLADCFKYRNKIGMDTVLEALKLYRERKKIKINELIKYAKICRVDNIMRPYLESLL